MVEDADVPDLAHQKGNMKYRYDNILTFILFLFGSQWPISLGCFHWELKQPEVGPNHGVLKKKLDVKVYPLYSHQTLHAKLIFSAKQSLLQI